MKKILPFILLFFFAISFGQNNISDYQYIFIPKEFQDAKANKYSLNDLLTKKLKSKKFVIIKDIIEFNCETLKAEVSDTGNFFKNKIQINFKDCHDKTVATFDGKSTTKDLETGMQEALQNALNGISVSNPVTKVVAENEKMVQNPEQTPTKITEPVQENLVPKNETKSEIYSNGILNLNRIFISDGQFILANPNNSTPYAIFKTSTKKDVYRVQLENGTQTFGYLENGKIVIEIPNVDGSFKKEEFSKK